MCEESHYDAAVLDALSDLSEFELLILPDSTVITPDVKAKLKAFHEKGGKLIISHRSGFDPQGLWALDFLPLTFHGDVEKFPTYWRSRSDFSQEMSRATGYFTTRGATSKEGREPLFWSIVCCPILREPTSHSVRISKRRRSRRPMNFLPLSPVKDSFILQIPFSENIDKRAI